MTGRLLAIGDIHGCYRPFLQLLDKLRPGPADQLVLMGDYLDRGPDPRSVINTLLSLRKTLPRLVCLKGNHEAMFLEFYGSGSGEERFLINGGDRTLDSYGLTLNDARAGKGFPEEHLAFLDSLPLLYERGDYLFVHGGLRPGVALADQLPQDLLWIRREFFESDWDFGKTVVFGHSPLTEPLIRDGKIGIDTGAVYGGKLTAIELPSCRIIQVPAGNGPLY